MRAVVFAGVALLAVSCGGTLPDDFSTADPSCTVDRPPAAPVVVTPFAGASDLLSDEIAISASQFSDPDGDAMGGAEVELWAVSPLGVETSRIWSAQMSSMPAVVKISDGVFDFGLEDVQEDTDYAVRVRYRDARPPVGDHDCSTWSDWSAWRTFHTDDGSRALFDDTKIQDIYLEIPQDSWDAINAEARPPGCVPFERTYHKGAITIGGQRFDDVGIHAKGGCGSARNLSGKGEFKINLEWDDPDVPGCPEHRRYAGQRTITLNNGVQDQTAGHERVAYEFFHAMGVGSARIATVRVNVNGAYWGVYQLVESVERPMLKRWYKSNAGMLYEGTYWCDVASQNLPVGDVDNKCLTREFHPSECDAPDDVGSDPQTYDPVRDFVAKLDAIPAGQFLPAARQFLDLDEFLSDWAAASVLGHWDSYELNIVNNYRIYHDPSTGLWHFLPSGLDQTMGSDVNPFGPNGRVAQLCLQNTECKALFAARLREAAATFESLDLVRRAQQIHDQIMADVQADPRKEYSMATWESANANWRAWIAARPAQIRQKLAQAGFPGP